MGGQRGDEAEGSGRVGRSGIGPTGGRRVGRARGAGGDGSVGQVGRTGGPVKVRCLLPRRMVEKEMHQMAALRG